jgi:hypothetical protein
MCVTLSAKVREEFGHNRHWPGVKGCIAAIGKSLESLSNIGDEVDVGLDDDDRLIVAVIAEVVVVVSGISMDRSDVVAAKLMCVSNSIVLRS